MRLSTALVFLFFVQISDADELRLASIAGLSEQNVAKIVIPQLFEYINLQVSVTPLPANRALADLNAGRLDGEVMRIYSYGQENANAIRVPTPYYRLNTAAFVRKDSTIKVHNALSLKKYKVGKVAGVQHTIDITKGQLNVHDSPTNTVLFEQLTSGKIDIALTNLADGKHLIRQHDQFKQLTLANEALAHHSLYLYLHKKHAKLVPQLDNAILALTESGRLNQLIKQAEFISY